jgi:hypothetical protein
MTRMLVSAAVVAAAMLFLETAAHAQYNVVHVRAGRGSEGSGLAFRRSGGGCFVLTAAHVVARDVATDSARPWAVVTVTDSDRNPYRQRDFESFRGVDIAVLGFDLTDLQSRTLCGRWPHGRKPATTSGELRFQRPAGVGHSYPAHLSGQAGVAVQICVNNVSRDSVAQGMSGSLLFQGDPPAPVAIVIVGAADAGGCLEGYSLAGLETTLGEFLRRIPPPPRGTVVGSVLAPGLGQWHTARKGWGVTWWTATVAAVGAMTWVHTTETRTRTFDDFFGTPRTYPYQARVYPLRGAWPVVWLLSGALSAVEANQRAKARADPALDRRRRSVRRFARPSGGAGDPPALTIEISF